MLPQTPADLDRFLIDQEGPTLECKEAKADFSARKLRQYLCALANEGGGHLVLGVSDVWPRRVVGTAAFPNAYADLNQVAQDLRPPPLVDARVVDHADGRVLVFEAGPRPAGQVVRYDRTAWVRLGESLTEMRDEELHRVLLETLDATVEPDAGATLADLDPEAIARFRVGVVGKTASDASRARFEAMPLPDLLRNVGLARTDGTLRRAALLLLGTEAALADGMPNAEIVFEYRTEATATRYDHRSTYRGGALVALDDLWETIRPYATLRPVEVPDGTQVQRLPRFSERSIREALLNAVAHRDYHDPESVLVRLSPGALTVQSPGSLPATITPANVADEQFRRNRRLAEALERCGRIERSGQGVDLMIEAAVRMAQPLPVFEEPGGRAVRVTLDGEVDLPILSRLRKVPETTWERLQPSDLVALDAVRRRVPRRDVPREALRRLIEIGIVEPGGTGDSPLAYSAAVGTDGVPPGRSPAGVLMLLRDAPPEGVLAPVVADRLGEDLPEVQRILQWLRRNRLAHTTGRTRGTRWHYGPPPAAVGDAAERRI